MPPTQSPRRRIRRAPATRARRQHLPIAAATAALFVAACGGGTDGSGGAERSADTTDAVADTTGSSAPVTTEAPSTTQASTTTAAPSTTTEAATPAFPATGDWAEWLVVRRVTTDDGYFGSSPGEPVIEARTYWMRCDDATCARPQFEPRGLAEWESNDTTNTALLEDGIMSWAEATTGPCVSTTTGQVDGPEESEVVRSFGLAPVAADGSVWQGVYDEEVTTIGSTACAAEAVAYSADMWLFDPAAVDRSDEAIGTWSGENGEVRGIERGVRACEPDEACELMLRQAIDDPNNPAGSTRRFIDFPLSRDTTGTWYGRAEYDESCLSDLDNAYLAEQGYRTAHELWLTVYDLGPDSTQRLVAEVTERRTGSAHPSLAADLAALCGDFEVAVRFIGLPIDTPTMTDWTKPAQVAEPFPVG